ncbi:hypothetical protein [Kineosporia succinea]|uniref:Ornithine cyclodeaminase/alanine dehydrogenase-like protein (Mu-crystallin family) n=1 Tax=Kineosporia succinea TaxID=84632 RepID=A0ABT9PDY3_9ACTN|nr:hypothetical protein [Kineosporia succinea]MDP9830913.1 ornithine cyclodeaminase/alanine dehydrogenase-like protein (mu-crystallin family) [Kineosporia succinea]
MDNVVRQLRDPDVDGLIGDQESLLALIDAVQLSLADLGRGEAWQMPKRMIPAADGGFFLSLGGCVPRLGLAAAKWASYVPGTPGRHGNSTSTIMVSDASSGELRAVVSGMRATALRTAASTVAAIRAARPTLLDPSRKTTVAFFGFGATNRTVLELLQRTGLAAGVGRVVVVVATPEGAERARKHPLGRGIELVAGTEPTLADGADLIVTATGSSAPVVSLTALAEGGLGVSLDGSRTWVTEPGAHVLDDQSRPDAPPPVAQLIAGTFEGPMDRLLLDTAGSAVADVATAAVLLGEG